MGFCTRCLGKRLKSAKHWNKADTCIYSSIAKAARSNITGWHLNNASDVYMYISEFMYNMSRPLQITEHFLRPCGGQMNS